MCCITSGRNFFRVVRMSSVVQILLYALVSSECAHGTRQVMTQIASLACRWGRPKRSHCEKNNDADAIIWRSIICLSTECVHRKHCFHNFFFDHSLDIVHAHHTDLVVVRGEIQKSSAKSLGFIYKSLCTNFGSIASGYYSGPVERLRMSTREGQVWPTFFHVSKQIIFNLQVISKRLL